jgi:CheY-like chemotaxis protein
MVFDAMEQAGGFVSLDSELGRGTVFRLFFPIADAAPEELGRAPAARRPNPETAGSILVVEDNEAVRRLVETMLRDAGYDVRAVGTAHDALAERTRVPTTLVTDIVMPQMSGPALAARLFERNPTLRALYITGYAPVPPAGDRRMLTRLLRKPFRSDELMLALAELWDPRTP